MHKVYSQRSAKGRKKSKSTYSNVRRPGAGKVTRPRSAARSQRAAHGVIERGTIDDMLEPAVRTLQKLEGPLARFVLATTSLPVATVVIGAAYFAGGVSLVKDVMLFINPMLAMILTYYFTKNAQRNDRSTKKH